MTKAKVPLEAAQGVADKLIADLSPYCERLAVAGSIRRKKPIVGDVELVAIPKFGRDLFGEVDPRQDFFDAQLRKLVSAGKIFTSPGDGREYRPAWGSKYKKVWLLLSERLGEIQVDVFICEERNWGSIFTIRTGPAEFSEALVTRIKHQTPYRQQDGYLVDERTGEIVPVPEEEDYFRLAGVKWLEPERRLVEHIR